MDRKKGFICYAHDDKLMFEEVRKQLTALESAFPIDFWNDPSLRGGDLWDSVIKAEVMQPAPCAVPTPDLGQ